MVGHLDAVGLHGVARAIVEVAHVRVVEVGDALLDHLVRVKTFSAGRRGFCFALGAPSCASGGLTGLARRRQRARCARPGRDLRCGASGVSEGALAALESSFERRLSCQAAAPGCGVFRRLLSRAMSCSNTPSEARPSFSRLKVRGDLLVCYRTLGRAVVALRSAPLPSLPCSAECS